MGGPGGALLLLPLAGCLDYAFSGDPPPEYPRIAVAPEAVSVEAVCGRTEQAIDVWNLGDGTLRVDALQVEGVGWSVGPVALPLEIAATEHATITLLGEPGDATLHVRSDDEAHPVVDVPLHATENDKPGAMVTVPAEDEFVAPDGDLVLTGFVWDTEDDPTTMVATWVSSTVGVLGTVTPDASGRVAFTWPEGERPTGPQTTQLTVADACGDVGENTVYWCQEGPWSFNPSDDSTWIVSGSAATDDAADLVTLTSGAPGTAGSVFSAGEVVDGDRMEVTFGFALDGGEGLSFTLLDAERRVVYLGGDGCGIGYGGGVPCAAGDALPGWSVEIDVHDDAGVDDLSGDHIAFVFDGRVDAPALEASLPDLDAGAHDLRVEVDAPEVHVVLDGVEVLAGEVDGLTPFRGAIGFTAATGDEAATVEVFDVLGTDFTCSF